MTKKRVEAKQLNIFNLLRRTYGYQLSEVSSYLGVPVSLLLDIENGQIFPDDDLLSQFSQIYSIDMKTLNYFKEHSSLRRKRNQQILLKLLSFIA